MKETTELYHCWVPGGVEDIFLIEKSQEDAEGQAKEILGPDAFVVPYPEENAPLPASDQREYLIRYLPKLLHHLMEKIDKEDFAGVMNIINAQKDYTFIKYAGQLLCNKINEIYIRHD